MSGENVKQEYGIRMGYWFENGLSLHGQILAQTDKMLAAGNTYMATVFMRIRIIKFLELSLGASLWKDTRESLLGNKDKFYKLMWGIVIPF